MVNAFDLVTIIYGTNERECSNSKVELPPSYAVSYFCNNCCTNYVHCILQGLANTGHWMNWCQCVKKYYWAM